MADDNVPSEKGDKPSLPHLIVEFDATTQSIGLRFDQKHFRNWTFIAALLEMAAGEAKFQGKMALQRAMQQQAMQAMQAEAIRQEIGAGQTIGKKKLAIG